MDDSNLMILGHIVNIDEMLMLAKGQGHKVKGQGHMYIYVNISFWL